ERSSLSHPPGERSEPAVDQPVEAVQDPPNRQILGGGHLGDRPDGGIHARSITSAGENSDRHRIRVPRVPSSLPMSVLTPDVLWDIPRVGAPRPVAGDRLIVPVTTYDTEGAATTCLWRLDPASGERRRFTSGSISGLDASADGASVAYLKKVGDWKQVFVQPVDGGEGRQVGDLPLGAVGVRWLPDGRLVALARLWADRPTLDETRDHD